ncbi:MAG: hypothetical protein ACTSYC_10475 [Promethearchaeota archaeon]
MVLARDYDDTGTWDVELDEKDKANIEKALELEISNIIFFKCANKKVLELEGQKLFKILIKVEN